MALIQSRPPGLCSWVILETLQTYVELLSAMTSQINGCPHFFVFLLYNFCLKLIVTYSLCVLYVREDNDTNVYAMITGGLLLQYVALFQSRPPGLCSWVILETLQTYVELLSAMTSQINGCPHFFVFLLYNFCLKLIVTYSLCVLYVREDNDTNVYAMITGLYGLHGPWCPRSEKGC